MDEFTWLKTKLGHNKEITDLHEIHSTPFGKVVRVRSGDELFYFKTDDLLRFEAEKLSMYHVVFVGKHQTLSTIVGKSVGF